MKIRPIAFSLTLSVMWATLVLILTWTTLYARGYGRSFIKNIVQPLYPWYDITFWGAFVGAAYGAVTAFAAGYLFVTIYNFIAWDED